MEEQSQGTTGSATASAAAEEAEKSPVFSKSDQHKLVADISVFHYKRLRMVASERGIPVGQLLEELIDRMWTYRSG